MYSVVLATALMATATTPTWHHRCSSCHSCYSGYGCYGGFSCYSGYSGYAGYGCSYGCYSCYQGPAGYGCAGACYGYHGGCYSGWGVWSGGEPYLGGCTGCYGCYGGYAGYGVPVPLPEGAPGTKGGPGVRDPFPPINPEANPKKSGPETVVPPDEVKKKVSSNVESFRAKIRIDIPVGAKLYVDGRQIQAAPGVRTFNTPALAAGQVYFYDFRIEVERDGRVQTEQRRVIIRSGEDVAVNFPNLQTAPALTARRGQ